MKDRPQTPPIEQFDLVHTCRECSRVCLNNCEWEEAADLKINLEDSSLSYGICPSCIKETFPDCPTKFFRRELDFEDVSDLVPVT